MDIWTCSICLLFSTLTLKMLVRHIAVEHATMPNFRVKCGVHGCPEEYEKMNSFRKHLQRFHEDEYAVNANDIHAEEQHINGFLTEEQPTNCDPTQESSGESSENYDDETSIDPVVNLNNVNENPEINLESCAAQFLVKIQSRSKISKVAVNSVVQETSLLIDRVKNHLQQKVIESKVSNNGQLTEQTINEVFEAFEDPFSNFQTTNLQSSFIKKNMNYVHPIQYVLGHNIGFKNRGAKRQICETDDCMVYIPILQSIEQLLSNPRIYDMITNPPNPCKDGVLYDISDGTCFKNKPVFQDHCNALQVILYHDEIEVCNPLGSHIGKHKLDLYYYTLGNINPKFRSKLCAIRLLAIVKAKDVQKYGHGKILTPIVNDLEKLSAGHSFVVKGSPMILYGAVISCLGDTEGQHRWGGFKASVGWAHQKCRDCLCTFEDMQQKFMDTLFTARNLQQYSQQCRDIENAPTEATKKDFQTTYGIVERSLLSELCFFDITKQLPQDIMHVLLEGSVQYEVRFILQHYLDSGVITLRQLNNAFIQFSLGYHDEKNRPPPLRESTFNGQETYKMKQTAEQARIFLKNLPFILQEYVAHDNHYYQLLLQIITIVQICFSPVISHERIQELQDVIESHLRNFKQLFPAINVTPKMHYMVHIPQQTLYLGPLVRHSCMRFEARHRYFKDIAPLQNFKNICLSLAERYQLDECANFCNDSPDHHPLFKTEKNLGPVKRVENVELTLFHQRLSVEDLIINPEILDQVYTTKWIKVHGTKYATHRGCIVAVDANFANRMPIFGQLENIWLANELVIFEYTALRTLEFCLSLAAYKVERFCEFRRSEFCLHHRILDFNIYSLVELNQGLYISLKYDLRDIIEQHIVGANPLHF